MTFARYRADAHRALEVARAAAAELHHNYVGTEHLLLALTTEDFGAATAALADCGVTRPAIQNQVARAPRIEHRALTDTDAEALAMLGIDLEEVRRRVEETFGHFALDAPRACDYGTPLTDKSKRALQKTVQHAHRLGHKRVGPEHLLLALLEDDSGLAVKLIRRLGVAPDLLRERTLAAIRAQ